MMALRFGAAVLSGLSLFGASVLAPPLAAGSGRRSVTGKGTTTTSAPQPASWRVLGVSSKGLGEVSGCAVSRQDPNRVWLHNDAGDGAIVVPVNITSGKAGRPVTLGGVKIVDPEDMAITAGGDIILADIGDNAVTRRSVQLYRFAEPAVNATAATATRLDLQYPDGPHNAEALVVTPDGSAAFIFTKELSGIAAVFRADLTVSQPQELTQVGKVAITGEVGSKANLISAADAIGRTVLLRTYQFGYVLDVPGGGKIDDAASASPRRFSLPPMVQGEALCTSSDGRKLVTASESQGSATFAVAVGPLPR